MDEFYRKRINELADTSQFKRTEEVRVEARLHTLLHPQDPVICVVSFETYAKMSIELTTNDID